MKPHPTKSKPCIAPGHNPDKLTVEQVGAEWRLLQRAEVLYLDTIGERNDKLSAWDKDIMRWNGTGQYSGGNLEFTYRTKQPPGYFLPKKPKPSPRQPVKGARRMWADKLDGIAIGLCAKSHAVHPHPVLVLPLSPEARERRVEAGAKALYNQSWHPKDEPKAIRDLRLGMYGSPATWEQLVTESPENTIVKNCRAKARAVLSSIGDTPAGEGRGK